MLVDVQKMFNFRGIRKMMVLELTTNQM